MGLFFYFRSCGLSGEFLLTQHGLHDSNLAAALGDLRGIVDGRYRVRYFQFTISLLGDLNLVAQFLNA